MPWSMPGDMQRSLELNSWCMLSFGTAASPPSPTLLERKSCADFLRTDGSKCELMRYDCTITQIRVKDEMNVDVSAINNYMRTHIDSDCIPHPIADA